MIVLGCKNICKSYGIDVILDNISFNLNKGDRVGVVGNNGAGKSTLLNILAGKKSYDSGDVFIPKDVKVELLSQDFQYNKDMSVLEVAKESIKHILAIEKEIDSNNSKLTLLDSDKDFSEIEKVIEKNAQLMERFNSARGYAVETELKGILQAMGFKEEEFSKKVSLLSGGEKTRLSLGCILMKNPEVLLLDEPTNHLDIEAIQWLEEYLKGYNGTFMVISHDRYFLNKVTNKTLEIENRKASIYSGGYDFYALEKKKRFEAELKKYQAYKSEVEKQEEIIRRFKQHGTEKLAKRAASREKRLEKIKPIEKVSENTSRMGLRLKQNFKSGKDVLTTEDLGKKIGYGLSENRLFQNVNIDVKRGEKICIVGANGIGKTTFLKMIKGDVKESEGSLSLGHNVEIGYYDQNQEMLNEGNTVLDEIHNSYRLYSRGEVRGFLGRFMFKDDMINLPIRSLSGGEKARLSLLKLMLQGANFLLLDEPTNHLDIQSKEVFEDSIKDFEGTTIIISHDRYLLSKVPDKILEITPNGAKVYLGKYDYYMEKRKESASATSFDDSLEVRAVSEYAKGKGISTGNEEDDGKERLKAQNKEILSSKEERRIKKEQEMKQKRLERMKTSLEGEISVLEKKRDEIKQLFEREDIMADHKKLKDIGSQYSEIELKLEEKYDEWLQLENL